MINLGVLLVGFILGVFALGLLIFLVILHRPRYEAPTLSRRRNRDKRKLFDELTEGMDELARQRKAAELEESEERVRYQFMGATGLEE
jgi:hypothetical protein